MDNFKVSPSSVISGLSQLIYNDLRAQKTEERLRSYSGNQMDQIIEGYRERAAILRRIRAEFEDLMAAPL